MFLTKCNKETLFGKKCFLTEKMVLFGKLKSHMMVNIHFNFINNLSETNKISIKIGNMVEVPSY